MTRHYLTLFDSSYAVKGALMLASLADHSSEPYEVTLIALSDCVAAIPWINTRVVSVAALEAAVPGLQAARAQRTWREYCWTLASVATRWRLAQLEPGEALTYLDADLGFFGDPAACFAELGNRSIGIVPHRFAPVHRDYEAASGLFNVSWLSLRNDDIGRACVEDWAGRVLARCSESECGDQRHLDAWPDRYGAALHVFDSPGIGVAPWNVFAYRVEPGHTVTVDEQPVVFYHYHEFRREPNPANRHGPCLDEFCLSGYSRLRPIDIDVFYRDYCHRYRTAAEELGIE